MRRLSPARSVLVGWATLAAVIALGSGCTGTDGDYAIVESEDRPPETAGPDLRRGETIMHPAPSSPSFPPHRAVACGSAACGGDERCCVTIAPATLFHAQGHGNDDKDKKDKDKKDKKDKDKNRDGGAPSPPDPSPPGPTLPAPSPPGPTPPAPSPPPLPPLGTTYVCTAAPACAPTTTIALECATTADCLEGQTCCMRRTTAPGVTWSASCRATCALPDTEMCTMARASCKSTESCVSSRAAAIGLMNAYGFCEAVL
jgi:hypothetical protein